MLRRLALAEQLLSLLRVTRTGLGVDPGRLPDRGDRCRECLPLLPPRAGRHPRTLYFDGSQADLERDLGVYMELARNYRRNKKVKRG